MSDCIFCKIITGEIPAKFVYEDEHVVAFNDIHPKAPTHILMIPRKHVPKLADLEWTDSMLAGHMMLAVGKIASAVGIRENGFRVVINNGSFAGQEVFHLHFHILGGKQMTWNPA